MVGEESELLCIVGGREGSGWRCPTMSTQKLDSWHGLLPYRFAAVFHCFTKSPVRKNQLTFKIKKAPKAGFVCGKTSESSVWWWWWGIWKKQKRRTKESDL